MNQRRFFYSIIAMVAIFVATLCSCKEEIKVTGVELNKSTLTLYIGESENLVATVQPADAENQAVVWSIDNDVVARVNRGKVTAQAEGTATVTVTTKDGDKTATCVVIVTKPPHPSIPEMVFVEGGTFTMGCTDGECQTNEEPAHQVTLSSFNIAKYPVTQAQWKAIMDTVPSNFKGDHLPVEKVSWNDVQEFISRLNDSTGKNYRLPTEAEWEYAARGGNQGNNGYKYSGSNDVNTVAWYSANSGNITHDVGTKAHNELGIYDMSGNVNEWCSDWMGPYSADPQTNPQGPGTGAMRVARGGSCTETSTTNCRVSYRTQFGPTTQISSVGFRLVLP